MLFLDPSVDTVTNTPDKQPSNVDGSNNINYGTPQTPDTIAALGEDENSGLSKPLIYLIGGVLVLLIIGVIAFVIIRKRKQQNNENMQVSPVNSTASSNMSDIDVL